MNQKQEKAFRPLYKYVPFNEWSQNIFERNEVFFQSPDSFNDTFDSKIAFIYEGTVEQRIARVAGLWQAGPAKDKSVESLHLRAEEFVKAGRDEGLILE